VKNDEPVYGMKEHASIDVESGLVLTAILSKASEPERLRDRAEQDDIEGTLQDRAVLWGDSFASWSIASAGYHPCKGGVGSDVSGDSVQYEAVIPGGDKKAHSCNGLLGTGVSGAWKCCRKQG